MSEDDPRFWYLERDELGWFIANDDPAAGDLFGVRYATKKQAEEALDDLVANHLLNEPQ